VVRLDATTRRVVVGPREALRMDRIALRDINWIGDGALDRAIGSGLEIFVRVRSTRAPQPAWLRGGNGHYEVELVAGEEGVSPGQACVFYDAASGQAREPCGEAARRSRARIGSFRGARGMGDIDREGVEKAYGRWAPVYDLVFGKVFDSGRQSTIAEADRIGGRILDVGVGTGLSLSDYSREVKLCGVDISEPMLRKAQARVRAQNLANVETLAVMDAKHLAFKDASFDAVVAQYVITAVPDPEATLDDFVRVLKPGGELILVNHIGAEHGPRRIFELAFAPLARRLGWRPEFPWERLVKWAARHGGVTLAERRPMPPMGHFSLIRYRKS
jgi:phosphatidylethanolamine/phosphatidyl-N-methylethanolamine N-methyltransferase